MPDDQKAMPGQQVHSNADACPEDETLEHSFNFIVKLGTSGDAMARNAALILSAHFDEFANLNKRDIGAWRIEQRNKLLRHLHKTMAPDAIHAQWFRYQAIAWNRDKFHPNPYMEDDPRHSFYRMLKLHDGRKLQDAVLDKETLERMFRRWRAQKSGTD